MAVAFVAERFHLDPMVVASEPSLVVRRLRSACAALLGAIEKHEMDKAKAKGGG